MDVNEDCQFNFCQLAVKAYQGIHSNITINLSDVVFVCIFYLVWWIRHMLVACVRKEKTNQKQNCSDSIRIHVNKLVSLVLHLSYRLMTFFRYNELILSCWLCLHVGSNPNEVEHVFQLGNTRIRQNLANLPSFQMRWKNTQLLSGNLLIRWMRRRGSESECHPPLLLLIW